MTKKSIGIARALVSCLLLVTLFQNCSRQKVTGSSETTKLNSADNGQPYSGKPDVFRRFDTTQPCSDLDRNGKPLPNDEIILVQDASGRLVRNLCRDIEPVVIPSADLMMDGDSPGQLVYKGQTFSALNPPSAFDIVVPPCPNGVTPKSNPTPSNVFVSPLNLVGIPNGLNWAPGNWLMHPGIVAGLSATIASLPAYSIQRNDANNLDSWKRDSQLVTLQSNTNYAFSFLAQPGTVNAADWLFFRQLGSTTTSAANEQALITFNFQNLSAKIINSTNIQNLSATITPFGNGFLCTVYFTSSATSDQGPSTEIGLTPSTPNAYGQLGDSITATATELVPVNQICQ